MYPKLPIHRLLAILAVGLFSATTLAATTTATNSNWGWNLIIALVVLSATAASAALPIAAIRQWPGYWKPLSALPMLALVVWVVIIGVSKLADADSHPLWSLEIFAWAMLNMIYMVTLMTAKRQFEKADEKNKLNH